MIYWVASSAKTVTVKKLAKLICYKEKLKNLFQMTTLVNSRFIKVSYKTTNCLKQPLELSTYTGLTAVINKSWHKHFRIV